MAIHKLTALSAVKISKPGLHGDGGGLYLNVGRNSTRSWVLRFSLNGRTREMGLGSLNDISLAVARERAAEARRQLADGVDPIAARETARAEARASQTKATTFKQCATLCIAARAGGWRNAKHAAQWTSTLETYAYPTLGNMSVGEVDAAAVLAVLQPIWLAKRETANRVRGRIEAVLDWAKALGFCTGDNPARWRGHMANLLPQRKADQGVVHHAALAYHDVPGFIAELRQNESTSARCLEFVILTACRTSEAIEGRWEEIDRVAAVWTIPAARMKSAREHRVPLTGAVLDVVDRLQAARQSEYIFPAGNRRGRHLSNMAMLTLLGRMGRGDITVHGFRSAFRDWAEERTELGHVAEAALAHVVKDKVVAAYRRTDLFEKRQELMEAWARFCGSSP